MVKTVDKPRIRVVLHDFDFDLKKISNFMIRKTKKMMQGFARKVRLHRKIKLTIEIHNLFLIEFVMDKIIV